MIEYFLLFFCGLDVILTHYSLELMKRKGCYNSKLEINFIPRLLINNKPNWKRATIHAVFQVGMFSALIFWMGYFSGDSVIYYGLIGCLGGIVIIINYLHWLNLSDVFNNWDNDLYWKVKKYEFSIKRW